MAKTVGEVMTRNPVALSADSSVVDAARAMSDMRIGTVVVMDGNKPCGIVTDRDITVRAIATGSDPATTKLADISSKDLAVVRPDQSVEDAMQMMKAHDVKRVLVMSESRLEGIVSLGDLAREGDDAENVVEDISRAEPNG
jgi:CBS domain-containing protein